MTTYNDDYNEYPLHSHQPNPKHAETCQVCGALIMIDGEDDGWGGRVSEALRIITDKVRVWKTHH